MHVSRIPSLRGPGGGEMATGFLRLLELGPPFPPPLRLRGRPFGHGRYLVDSGPGVGGLFLRRGGCYGNPWGFFRGWGGVESTRRVTDHDVTRSSV